MKTKTLKEAEADAIRAAMLVATTSINIASLLGVSRATFYRLIKKHEIKRGVSNA